MAKGNSRRERFIEEYMMDRNGTKAAMRAGFSKVYTSAAVHAARLLKIANVRDEIDKRIAEENERYAITPENILKELSKLAYANSENYMRVGKDGKPVLDLRKMKRHEAAAIEGIEEEVPGRSGVKLKLASKTKALELLGKYQKLFVDRVEVDGLDKLAERLARARKKK